MPLITHSAAATSYLRWIRVKEDQLDQQRKFILERLETAREKLDDLRARESMASEKRGLMENLVQWAGKFGKGLDNLPDEKRRDVLRLLVDQILVDRNNNVSITLGIPTEDFVSIEKEESPYPFLNRRQKLRYSWAVDLDAAGSGGTGVGG